MKKNLFDYQSIRIFVGGISLLCIWELLALYINDEKLLPYFHTIISAISKSHSSLSPHILETLIESIIAFMSTLVLAAIFSLIMDRLKLFDIILYYPIISLQNIPKAAFAFLLVIWFGHGMKPKIATGILVAFYPIFEGFRNGLKADRTGLRSTFSLLNPKWIKMLLKVRLPESVPSILQASKLGIAFSTVGVIIGEMAQPDKGLGFLIKQGEDIFQTDMQFAAVFLVSIMGIFLYVLIALLENLPWLSRFKNPISSTIAKE